MNILKNSIQKYPWLIPTILFSILVFVAANMHPLWGDEAETALFGRNILKYGIPRGWDGTNIMGIENAVVLDKNLINHTSPWLQYYLTALSFLFLGESSFTARLPFIIIAIVSVSLFYPVAKEISKNKKTALLATIILSVNIPFILFSFQARYYSTNRFASLLFILSLFHLHSPKRWPKYLFVFSSVLFFYSNYVVFIAFLFAAFLSYLVYLWIRKETLKSIAEFSLRFILLSIIGSLFWLPWYIVMNPSGNRTEINPYGLGTILEGVFIFLRGALHIYHDYGAFPFVFIIPYLYFLGIRIKQKKDISAFLFPLLLSVLFLFILSVFSSLFIVNTVFVASRYTMVIYCFFSLALATLFMDLFKFQKHVTYLLLILYMTTNIFTFSPIRSLPIEFMKEVVRPYKTPDREVANFLEKNAKNGDTAFINLDRDHEPLIFYLKNKIKFVNRVSLTNTRIFPKNRTLIPRYIYSFRDKPDWIILYSKRGNDGSFLTFDYRPTDPNINLKEDYTEVPLPIFFSDMSRPEIELRSFTEIKPSYQDQVFIYKKKT